MDASDEKFFESLVNGGGDTAAADDGTAGAKPERKAEREEAPEPKLIDAEEGAVTAMGSYASEPYHVELAKASTAAAHRTRSGSARITKANDPIEPEGQLTVDVFQTPDAIVVESAIAGVRAEDIDINVTQDSVSIRGARDHETTVAREDYIYQECYWGRFARSIILPQEVDPENADVRLRNGILTIWLPKANKRKARKLNVRTE